MTDTKRVEIPFSKSKLAKLLIFSILFLAIGLWLIVKQPQTGNAVFNDPIVKNLAGYGGAIMGLFGVYFFSRKLLDKRPGLVIDEKGIIDNTSAFSFGLIPWLDIAEISDCSIQASITSRQKFVTIGLYNPDSYISRETSVIKRRLLMLNSKNYGSPVHISTNGIQINHDDLVKLLKEKFDDYKSLG